MSNELKCETQITSSQLICTFIVSSPHSINPVGGSPDTHASSGYKQLSIRGRTYYIGLQRSCDNRPNLDYRSTLHRHYRRVGDRLISFAVTGRMWNSLRRSYIRCKRWSVGDIWKHIYLGPRNRSALEAVSSQTQGTHRTYVACDA